MRAIIIGGGIGGLTAAIALRRIGVEADVYERSPVLGEVGAGISLWPNAVKAMGKLDLGPALDRISLVNTEGAVRRWNGSYISRTPARELERRFGGGVIVLHRAELLDMLVSAVGPERLHLGHACTTVEQDGDGVLAGFENGRSVTGGFLVGADGLRSQVRAILGLPQKLRHAGYVAWRSIVPSETTGLIAGESWGCGTRFGIMPIRGNRVYWFATANTALPRGPQAPSKARLLSLFRGWHEPVEALIRAADESSILESDIYDRDPAPAWGRGRITLLGDAAHPMTPNLGQGGCQAIEDALELALNLKRETNVEAALRNYEARRIARTKPVVLMSRRLGAMAQIENPLLCAARDACFRAMPQSWTYRSLAPVVGYEGHLTG